MRKPSSSNRVSEIQRLSATAVLLVMCPGRGAARQRCTAEPGPPDVGMQVRSRVCSAPLRAALRPGNAIPWAGALNALAAKQLAHRDVLRLKGFPQHRHTSVRIGLAAHE